MRVRGEWGEVGRMGASPRMGCGGVGLALGLALVLPFLVDHCPGGLRRSGRLAGAPPAPAARWDDLAPLRSAGSGGLASSARSAVRAPVSLEAWVWLRSYRGCPVLAAAGGYRLGLVCDATGASRGLVAFGGPFDGRAYISARPVPLGRWVHLAGMEGGPRGRARHRSPKRPSSPSTGSTSRQDGPWPAWRRCRWAATPGLAAPL